MSFFLAALHILRRLPQAFEVRPLAAQQELGRGVVETRALQLAGSRAELENFGP